MMFQEWIFLPFFLLSYGIYLVLRRNRLQMLWLLISSYVFYGWWHPLYLVVIAYLTIADFILAAVMEKSARKRLWVSVSVVNSLLLLGFFKYTQFLTENVNHLLASLHASWTVPPCALLPYAQSVTEKMNQALTPFHISWESPTVLQVLGISFFVFKSVAYMIECYRGTVQRERDFIRYAVFVSFFPLLIAGPIERAVNLLPQLRERIRVSREDLSAGLSLFTVGLFKKLALADCLVVYVDSIYKAPETADGLSLLVATFAYAWQIYFDFSGYTDMVRGVARLFGLRIMLNFNHPYLATSLSDFWRRWHISMSSWFRDYLYIPLGGNRKGTFRTYFNLLFTMLVSGLWHGASWTFVMWGAVLGVGSMLTRELERSDFYKNRIPAIFKQVFCFLIVCFAWIFFRATSLDQAGVIISRIFSTGFSDPRFPILLFALIGVTWLYQLAYESRVQRVLNLAPVRIAAMVLIVVYLVVISGSGVKPFIYQPI